MDATDGTEPSAATEPNAPTDQAEAPAPTQPSGVGRRRIPSSAVFAGALLLALSGVAAGLGITQPAQSAAAAASTPGSQQAALAAARREATAVTTLSWQSADSDLDRILAGAVPKSQLYTQFAAQRTQLPGLLKQNHSVSRGTVLSSALSSMAGGTAKALVAVDANISGSSGSPAVKHYRMLFTMQRVGGRWLARDVSFVGTPQ